MRKLFTDLLFRIGATLFLFLLSIQNIASEGCFENQELSCEPPENANEEGAGIDAHEVCSTLYWDFLGEDHFNNLSIHTELLNAIPADSELCGQVQKVYHQCRWCDQNSFCYLSGVNRCEVIPEVIDETIDVEATCKEILDIILNDARATTIEQCNRFGQVYHKCSIFCGDPFGERNSDNEGCFEAQELSCQPPEDVLDEDDAAIDVHQDVHAICYNIESYFFTIGRQDDIVNPETHAELMNIGISSDMEFCSKARRAYHLCYWCDPVHGSWCYGLGDACARPDVVDEAVDKEATCEELVEKIVQQGVWPTTIDLCYRAKQSFYTCSHFCAEDGEWLTYVGADSEVKRKVLNWMSRVSALLSFIGASYIIWDTLRSRRNREKIYHQLLLGMACFDICTAVAWAFSTAPLPADEIADLNWNVYGARGTWGTCIAQGFFIQLGQTSVFYNVSLASYYVMVVVRGWREQRLKKLRIVLHGIPLLVGFGLAFGGIPVYTWTPFACHIDYNYDNNYLRDVLIFFAIPIGFSILAITGCMVAVYRTVRRHARGSQRWRMGVGNTDTLERKVFWQCIAYGLAFYITWPILFGVYVGNLEARDRYGYSVTVAFVAPLQGFNNFLVYIHPRWRRYAQKNKRPCPGLGLCSSYIRRLSSRTLTDTTDSTDTESNRTLNRSVDPSVAIADEAYGRPEEAAVRETSDESDGVEEVCSSKQPVENDISEDESPEEGGVQVPYEETNNVREVSSTENFLEDLAVDPSVAIADEAYVRPEEAVVKETSGESDGVKAVCSSELPVEDVIREDESPEEGGVQVHFEETNDVREVSSTENFSDDLGTDIPFKGNDKTPQEAVVQVDSEESHAQVHFKESDDVEQASLTKELVDETGLSIADLAEDGNEKKEDEF